MDIVDLYSLFRREVRDLVTPYFWSDEEIYAYMNEAQNMFCRLQGGIADSTSVAAQIGVSSGDAFSDIHPRVLKIRHAQLASNNRELELLNFEDLETRVSCDDYGQRSGFKLDSTEGPVKAMVLGMEPTKVRLLNIPQEDDTINLIVYRLPLEEITIPIGAQPLEIPEQHQRSLLYWMKALAYEKQDAETYDRGKAVEFGEKFRAYCDQAKAERERSEHKYRATAYGGL